MSVDVLTPSHATLDATVRESEASDRTSLFGSYIELTKPRLVVLVLLTTAVGFWLGSKSALDLIAFSITLLGTALVAGGACAANQVLEAKQDARMRRTARRPLPSGRVAALPAAFFAAALGIAGVLTLLLVDTTAAVVAFATFVLYVGVYTPLKTRTTLNTAVGAVPGALPAVIGWAAASGRLSAEGWILFLLVFLWQFPHFLAIAWVYRDDYRRAGMRMLPCVDPSGAMTSLQACVYAALLLPAGLLPTAAGLAGVVCAAGSLVIGSVYLVSAWRFRRDVSDRTARKLMHASFLYLPVLLFLLVINASR